MQPTDLPADGQKARRFLPLLRLVSPAPPAAKRRKGLRASPVFSEIEAQLLRASLRSARSAFGSWKLLAAAMHVHESTLKTAASGRKPVTAEIAVRLSTAVNVPLDALTRPGLRPVKDPCPACGGAA